jgi:hypothetical protein
MPIFALHKIEAINGKQEFDKLIVDGRCPFDEFENNLEAQYKAELAGLYRNMQDVADLKALPYEKFHFYDNDKKKKNKSGVREFEFKTKHLRVYGITQPNGKLVITGGTKAKQKTDQNEFRKLKNLYLLAKNKE